MMNFNRRQLLVGTSAAALSAATPDSARLHGIQSAFDGGRSQIQSANLNFGGDYPFINFLKTAPQWSNLDNSGGGPLPSNLDSNGYPLTIANGGVRTSFQLPALANYSGIWVATWDGNGTIALAPQNNGTITPSAGYTNANLTSTSGSGRYEFTTTIDRDLLVFGITALTGPIITNVKIFMKTEEARLNAGNIFSLNYKQTLQAANCGVMRFMDWALAGANITTWATRKPLTYAFYGGYELRNSLYAGPTTSTGLNFAASFGAGGPVDKQTIHVNFDENAVSVSAASPAVVSWTNPGLRVGQAVMFRLLYPLSGASLPSPLDQNTTYYVASTTTNPFTISTTNGGANINTTGVTSVNATAFATQVPQTAVTLTIGAATTIGWTNHGLAVGDPVGIGSTQNFGMPAPMVNDKVWYAIAAGFTANSFQISATPGGTAVNTTGGTQSGTILAAAVATFNLNGTTKPILDVWGNPFNPFLNQAPYCGKNSVGTMTYDADIGGWLKQGADADPIGRQTVRLS